MQWRLILKCQAENTINFLELVKIISLAVYAAKLYVLRLESTDADGVAVDDTTDRAGRRQIT